LYFILLNYFPLVANMYAIQIEWNCTTVGGPNK